MIKRVLIYWSLLFISLPALSASWPMQLLPGDYPDPTILRDGDDYYMTHSPFWYHPGFLIWHSNDLFNWEPIVRVMEEYEGSLMAPELIKHNEKYYLYYPTSKGEIFVITSENIKGPWSDPVKLEVNGIDPGHISDSEGNRYLFTNNGWIVPLSQDGLEVTGERKKVYDGWIYPDSWETEGDDMWLESPKLFFYKGFYYMVSAEGGTAGPPTSHMCVVARSESPSGPWENSPYNPLVHTYSKSDNWWSKGHGTIIQDKDDNWWIIYHGYANGYHTLGRQTLIEPIEYTSDGWFMSKSEIVDNVPVQKKFGFDLNDDFSDSKPGLQWSFWKENGSEHIKIEDNILKMKAKGNSLPEGRIMLVTPQDKYYEIQVEVKPGIENKAGLLLFYNEKVYAGIMTDSSDIYIYNDADNIKKIENSFGKSLRFKMLNRGNNLDIYVHNDNNDSWSCLVKDLYVGDMHHNYHKEFLALRPALISVGNDEAEFKDFKYSKIEFSE